MFKIIKINTGTVLSIGIAGGAAYLIGKNSIIASPIILSSIKRGFELSATQAGIILTLEMLALAISSTLLSTIIGKIANRKLFLWGLLLLLLGHVFAALSDVVLLVVIARIIAGIGAGMIVVVANATMSSSSDPERAFALAFVISGIIAAAIMPVLTGLSDQFAHRGVFIFLAALSLLIAPLCKSMLKNSESHTMQPVILTTHPPLAYMTLLALFIYNCSVGSVWAFSEQMASQAGVESGKIGFIFAAAMSSGIAGGFMASWLSTKAGRIKPIIACGVVHILSILSLTTATTTFEYTASLILCAIALYFIMPYFLGVASMFDENGRWGAAGGGASLLGLAISASVGGVIIDWGGYKMIGIMFALSATLSILILTFVVNYYSNTTVPENEMA